MLGIVMVKLMVCDCHATAPFFINYVLSPLFLKNIPDGCGAKLANWMLADNEKM